MGLPVRIEPHTGPRPRPEDASDDLDRGLSNRLYDPLWMLARQLATGELVGADAGTPIAVTHRCEVREVTGWAPERDPDRVRELDPNHDVLEAVVEGQRPVWTSRLRWATGRELVALLAEHNVGAGDVATLLDAFQLTPPRPEDFTDDPAGARVRRLAAGRVPDGGLLYETLSAGLRADPQTLPAALALTDRDGVRAAATVWLTWIDALALGTREEDNAWDEEHHDYRFSLVSPSPQDTLRLTAQEHRGGDLDWHSFDVAPPEVGAADSRVKTRLSHTLPAPATFRGMPNPRWWTFEDGTFSPGKVESAPADLALLAALSYALVYGNDFFYVPVPLDVGSLCRTTSLLVTDTFGFTVRIKPAATRTGDDRAGRGSERWTMFTLTSGPNEVADQLFLPPISVQPGTSGRLEDVLMMRDEMANIAWAVERKFEGGAGESVARSEHQPLPAALPARLEAGQPASGLVYLLGTDVPTNWFPMIPQPHPAHAFRVSSVTAGDQEQARPRGVLLREGQRVADEEVPREGENLWRERVLARSADGSSVTWSRTRVSVGGGEGSSGLLFDRAVETGASEDSPA